VAVTAVLALAQVPTAANRSGETRSNVVAAAASTAARQQQQHRLYSRGSKFSNKAHADSGGGCSGGKEHSAGALVLVWPAEAAARPVARTRPCGIAASKQQLGNQRRQGALAGAAAAGTGDPWRRHQQQQHRASAAAGASGGRALQRRNSTAAAKLSGPRNRRL